MTHLMVHSQTNSQLLNRLIEEAPRREFVMLMRQIERLLAHGDTEPSKNLALIGTDALPQQESLRIKADPALAFPPTEVRSLRWAGSGNRIEITTNFLGLVGPNGALPRHYTAKALASLRNKENALLDFFQIFQSRLLALFYRAFSRFDVCSSLEMRQCRPDVFTQALCGVTGFQNDARLSELLGSDAEATSVLSFAGFYSQQRRGAVPLEQMLTAVLGVPVKTEQRVGQWLEIPSSQRTTLPRGNGGGVHHRLGRDTVLGRRIWDVASMLVLRIGPLDFEQYCRFISGGDRLRRVGLLSRLYVGLQYDLRIRPVLQAAAVPVWKLSSRATTHLLGRTIWLRRVSRDYPADFSQATYIPPEKSGA